MMTLEEVQDELREEIRSGFTWFAHNNDDEWSPVWAYGVDVPP